MKHEEHTCCHGKSTKNTTSLIPRRLGAAKVVQGTVLRHGDRPTEAVWVRCVQKLKIEIFQSNMNATLIANTIKEQGESSGFKPSAVVRFETSDQLEKGRAKPIAGSAINYGRQEGTGNDGKFYPSLFASLPTEVTHQVSAVVTTLPGTSPSVFVRFWFLPLFRPQRSPGHRELEMQPHCEETVCGFLVVFPTC